MKFLDKGKIKRTHTLTIESGEEPQLIETEIYSFSLDDKTYNFNTQKDFDWALMRMLPVVDNMKNFSMSVHKILQLSSQKAPLFKEGMNGYISNYLK